MIHCSAGGFPLALFEGTKHFTMWGEKHNTSAETIQMFDYEMSRV